MRLFKEVKFYISGHDTRMKVVYSNSEEKFGMMKTIDIVINPTNTKNLIEIANKLLDGVEG